MKLAIAGPIATQDIAHLIPTCTDALPAGYPGAPLMATLITELLKRGHEVAAFTTSMDLAPDTAQPMIVTADRFHMHYVPMRRKAWRLNGRRLGRIHDLYHDERRALQRALEAANPDVIHAHWSYEFAWAAQETGIPLVITCHDSPFLVARMYSLAHPSQSLYRWIRAWMGWHVLQRAKRVTAVSPYLRDQVQPLCKVPVSVIANPISEDVFDIPKHVRDGGIRLAMICNGWSQRKNPEAALRAYSLITDRFPSAVLHAFGYDFGVGEVANQWWVKNKLPGNVIFHGPTPHGELIRQLTSCDVLLHSALEESFGMVLAEAMALGVPVVGGVSSGAVPWVVGDTGFLVDVTDPQCIADAAMALLCDSDRYQETARKARERISSLFRARSVVDAYESEYAAVLDPARQSSRSSLRDKCDATSQN